MKDIILLKDFIDSLREFPDDTPVLFVSSKPEYTFSMSCDYYKDLDLPDGTKKDSLVFLYKFEDEENK